MRRFDFKFLTRSLTILFPPAVLYSIARTEHVNDMVYSVEKLNSLVGAARVDLEAFKAREHLHRQSTCEMLLWFDDFMTATW
jgi:hypothetical protein